MGRAYQYSIIKILVSLVDETLDRIVCSSKNSTNVWFELDVKVAADSITNKGDYVKGTDTMDVWFDSGVVGRRGGPQ